jgi:farnesyl-diphosphate farnesyltransferase
MSAAGTQSVEAWSGKDRGDENFPVGSLLIAPRLRRHVHAYYAFARNADDIADSPSLAEAEKIARLDVMQAVLLGETEEGSPSALALRHSLAATGVDAVHATDLLIAFRQDARRHRYESYAELAEYCRYSAMPVGRYVLDLHGEDRAAWAPSDALCTALQIENHLQDATADLARLDRCYLPQAWLREAGASVADLRRPTATPALRRVFDALLDACDQLNASARALPPSLRSRRLGLETAVIVGLSARLARRLRAADPVARRVRLRRTDALAALLRSLPGLFR